MFCLLVSLVHFKTDSVLSRVQREIPSFPHQVNPGPGSPAHFYKGACTFLFHIVITLKKSLMGTLCIFFLSFPLLCLSLPMGE